MSGDRRGREEIAQSALPEGSDGLSATQILVQSSLLDQVALVHEMAVDGRITRVNSQMCLTTGFDAVALIGANHGIINLELGPGQCWLRLHDEVVPGEMWSGETLNRTRSGDNLWLSSTIRAVRNQSGVLTGYICASIDVTERSRLREEFERSGKLMQLGQLTATVAHEIRNPLGAIRTANYVLERKIRGRVEGVEAQLERINNGIGRCDKIITELLDFSRRKTVKATACQIDDWVAATVEEEGKNLQGAPLVTCHLGLDRTEASFDPDQMRQVLINLLSNAAEALAEKNKLSDGDAFEPRIAVSTFRDGVYAKIKVEDNGPGIEPKNIARIREPLFTTKSFGVGLGIPAIEKILENHGGGLTIESEFSSGAAFTASFKCAPAMRGAA